MIATVPENPIAMAPPALLPKTLSIMFTVVLYNGSRSIIKTDDDTKMVLKSSIPLLKLLTTVVLVS